MDNVTRARDIEPEGNDKAGLIVLLIFIVGLPLLGILAKLLGYY